MSYTDPVEYYLRQQERRDNQIRNILSTFLAARQNKQEQGWKEKEYGLQERKVEESIKQQDVENQRQERELKMHEPYYQALTVDATARANRPENQTYQERLYDTLIKLGKTPEEANAAIRGEKSLDQIRAEAKAGAEGRTAGTPVKPAPGKNPPAIDIKKKRIEEAWGPSSSTPDPAKYQRAMDNLLGATKKSSIGEDLGAALSKFLGGEGSPVPGAGTQPTAPKGRTDIPPGAPPDVVAYMNNHPEKSFKESMVIYQKALQKVGK